MEIKRSYKIEGGNFSDAGFASSEIRKVVKQLGLPADIIKKIAIAVYEAEINVVAHAYHGEMHVTITKDKCQVIVDDEGPGIPDIDQAMTMGFSTASDKVREMGFGAGMGLPNIKQNADDLEITSKVDVGTKLVITINFNEKKVKEY